MPAALVAIDIPTGQVLASANRPWFGFDRALTGRYPPGSTFKVASTYALLAGNKVELTETVSCPQSFTVNGKRFRNFEGETLGSPRFADDVVHSCNTAFVQLAERLGDTDLTEAAKSLGIGAGWAATLGVAGAVDGSVPTVAGEVDKAAATIGQGKVIVSPMALAVMSASVARGAYLPPALVTDPAPTGRSTAAAATPLDPEAIADLRTVLRQVVTRGTGRRSPRRRAGRSRARPAPPSTATSHRPRRMPGSPATPGTSPSPSWSRTVAAEGRWPRRSPSSSSPSSPRDEANDRSGTEESLQGEPCHRGVAGDEGRRERRPGDGERGL